jgi:hypothetical protein
MKTLSVFLSLVLFLVCAGDARAAFIVEARSTATAGLGYGNFSGTHSNSSGTSSALGLTPALGSAYGSGVYQQAANYLYSYTPGTTAGTDADNYPVALDNRYFGNGVYSTNQTGGQTGYYNVYITWPTATNVNLAGCYLYITSDSGTTTVGPLDMNTGGTVAFAQTMVDNPPVGTIFQGGNNAWLRIARDVLLTSGNTYTVNQVSVGTDSVSARSSAVMWEYVSVPEPATIGILSLGALLVRRFRRS